jgi:hypothetical protein
MFDGVPPPAAAPAAFHRDAGPNRTFVKRTPAPLNPLAISVMVASGVFAGDLGRPRGSLVRIIAVVALLLIGGAVAIGDSVQSGDDGSRTKADMLMMAQPDEFYTLGLGDYRHAATKAESGGEALSDQDRFEIARMLWLTSKARER